MNFSLKHSKIRMIRRCYQYEVGAVSLFWHPKRICDISFISMFSFQWFDTFSIFSASFGQNKIHQFHFSFTTSLFFNTLYKFSSFAESVLQKLSIESIRAGASWNITKNMFYWFYWNLRFAFSKMLSFFGLFFGIIRFKIQKILIR